MKKYLIKIIFLIVPLLNFYAQTWQSMNYSNFSNTVPSGQFIINQYNNDIWMINDNKVSVIENTGTIQLFDDADLGVLWTGDNLRFTFTPDSIFYMLETFGLFNFNNYSSSLIISEYNISNINSGLDTVYISRMGTLLKYVDGSLTDTYFSAPKIAVKNAFLYTDNGYLGKQNGFSNQMLTSDPQYLFATINDKKFQRHRDSIYVGMTKGIMLAYNYDILDTITPNNSFNMPSQNVLEIEFDSDDSLWAVFGDVNDIPFALAKLEGDTWTTIFDASNSPIDFANFLSFEIDTLGNIWVADFNYLHTLLTPNSPGWLSLLDNEKAISFSISPNPSADFITVKSESMIDLIEIIDLQGRKVHSMDYHSFNPIVNLVDLKEGSYFIKVVSGNNIEFQQFVKH